MAPIQEEEDSTFTLSIGGVEFCLTPSPDVDDDHHRDHHDRDNDSMMSVSKIRNGEVLINLTNFVGTLRVKNYNIDAAGLSTSNMPSVYTGNNSGNNNRYSNTSRGRKRTTSGSGNDNDDNDHDHPKKKRINHSKDDTMKNAVEEWFRIKGMEGAPSRAKFARSRGIKPSSFSQYACDDPSKRRKLGARVGRTSLVSEQVSELLAQHFSLNNPNDNSNGNNENEDDEDDDNANDVVTNTPREVVEGLMQLQPELTMEQATNYVNRTWRRKQYNQSGHHGEEQQGQEKDEDNEDNDDGNNDGDNSGTYGGGNSADYGGGGNSADYGGGGRVATHNRNRGDDDLMLRHGNVPELPPNEHQHHYPHHRHHGLPKREHDYNDWS